MLKINKDSALNITFVGIGLCLLCSAIISFIAIQLRSVQENNVVLDMQKKIVSSAGLEKVYGSVENAMSNIKTLIIDLDKGEIVNISPDSYELAKELREDGSMTTPQIFGNWLATRLMKLFFKSRFTDLGPFRAIKYETLLGLEMEDKTYGWTVEMQLKALKQRLAYTEVKVPYRNRIGVSKISGTLKGAIFAGVKILGWIFKYSFK